jgi:homoserine kinase type II
MAVYTNLTAEHKEDIRTLYNLGKDADFIEIPEGILNTNYLIKDKDKKYVFRLLEGRRNIDEELKELELLNFLNKNDILCPQVSINNLGENHMFIQEKMGCLFDFIYGEKVSEINGDVLKKIGSTLARLHNLSRGRSIERTRKIDLDFFYDKISKIDLKSVLKEDYKLIMGKYKRVKGVDFSNLPNGIVHNDIFPDNVFMGEKLSLIDFNDCMNAPFIIDLVLKMALTFIFLRINKSYAEDNRGKNMEVKTYKELLILLEEEADEVY